jgi:hypothetical protein
MIHYGAGPNDGVVFAHQGDDDKYNDDADDKEGTTLVHDTKSHQTGGNKKHITCFNCKKKGHYKSECPKLNEKKDSDEATEVATSLLANGTEGEEVTLSQGRGRGSIPKNWVLLDN